MTVDEILDHHLEAFHAGDVDAILADFAEDGVLITPQGVARGAAEIRPLFEMFLREVLPPGSEFNVLFRHVTEEIGYIVWQAKNEKIEFDMGTDTFVVRGGKIVAQTTAASAVGPPPDEAD